MAEYVYAREQRDFGDLGPRLAAALRRRAANLGVELLEPREAIRATCIGASQYTVQLSGDTIFLSGPDILPVRSVPAVRVNARPSAPAVTQAVRQGMARLDLTGGGDDGSFANGRFALAVHWHHGADYASLRELCAGIVSALPGLANGHLVLVVIDADVAGLVGALLQQEFGVKGDIVCIDQVLLREFDFIDIGKPLPDQGVVPVVVKSLVFHYTWAPVGRGIGPVDATAVAVAPGDDGRPGMVYTGTEPSAVFRSFDGGDTWSELKGLATLPSASTWSFPPRPETHHVRWIGVDPHDADRLYVAIEAGALLRSLDRGDTWLDRTADGPYDTHTLALHPQARGCVYSAAGDGYYESRDECRSWKNDEAGLRHTYLFGIAVDPGDPDMVIVSAASGPGRAYSAPHATTYVYVRKRGASWQAVSNGLPDPRGTTIAFLASRREEPHTVYAANNRGLFRSTDAGATWSPLDLPWPERFLQQTVQGFVILSRESASVAA